MKTYCHIFIFCLNAISYGQNFEFLYTEDLSALAVKIDNDTMTYYSFYPKEGYYSGKLDRDSMYLADRIEQTIHFRKGTIDSIITLVDTLKGKKVIRTNSDIRCGGSQQIFIEATGWCAEFSLTNTFDSTAMRIVDLINCYLPYNNKILISYSSWEIDPTPEPILKKCNGISTNPIYHLYFNEGEQILKRVE